MDKDITTKTHSHVHTVSIQTPTDVLMIDHPAIKNQRGAFELTNGEHRVKFNPEQVDGVNTTTQTGFYIALETTIGECGIENARLHRIDIAWDSYDRNFMQLHRINALLLYLLAYKYEFTNICDTDDKFNIKQKSIKVQDTNNSNWTFQFEFYNKKLQKPNQIVQARLEFRFNGLTDIKISEQNKVQYVADKFKSMLRGIVSEHDSSYTRAAQQLNRNLVFAWNEEMSRDRQRPKDKSIRDFISHHRDSFLTKNQIADFIRKVRPDINNVPKRAKQLRDSLNLRLYDKNDLRAYVTNLLISLQEFTEK